MNGTSEMKMVLGGRYLVEDFSGSMMGEGRPFRSVSRDGEQGGWIFEMYDTLPDGTEWMVMEGVYTRP